MNVYNEMENVLGITVFFNLKQDFLLKYIHR